MSDILEFKNKRRINRAIYRARYEAMLALDMRRIFRIIGEDVALHYANGRGIPSIRHYQNDIESHLKMNYVKIAKVYKNNYRETQSSKALTDAELARLIDIQISQNINARSKKQSSFIITTLEDNINSDLQDVIIEATTQGIRPDRQAVADAAKRKFIRESVNRSDTIATTEFTGMSNDTIFAEASSIQDNTNRKLRKRWNAVLDFVTLAAHILADGQEAEMYEMFEVGGELMAFPGDASNGATAGNIINCRCLLDIGE